MGLKARVKATGEIVEVEFTERKTHTDEVVYITQEGCLIEESRLDFNVETIDYWTRLEHTYAGMAMQGILSNQTYTKHLLETSTSAKDARDIIVDASWYLANTLVKKMKEERK